MTYIMTYEDRYEPGEYEFETESLDNAVSFAGRVIEEGGWADITDENGNQYYPEDY